MMSAIKINSHIDEFLGLKDQAIAKALNEIGLLAVGFAQKNIQKNKSIQTGTLLNSIEHVVDGKDVYIGTNVKYAVYVEMGTGVWAEGGGRQTPWSYQDAKGKWHKTKGSRPKKFLRPAATEHQREYAQVMKDNLENA